VPLGGVAFGAAWALRRTARALIPTAAAAAALFAYTVADVFRLSHPDSFLDFAPSLLTAVGSLGAAAAPVVVLAARRRGRNTPVTAAERSWLRVALGCLGAVLVWSAVLTVGGRASTGTGDYAFEILLSKDRFLPRTFSIESGQTVHLSLRNVDPYAHTFDIDELGIGLYVGPRSERVVTITGQRPGSFRYLCRVTGHAGMTGTLIVAPS
jgi:plastocyanin